MSKAKKKESKSGTPELKLVVFGSGGVGKSALIVQLIQNVFVESYDPTLEDSYRKDCEIEGTKVTLDILDTAGQEEFRTLRDQYIRQGEGYIIVYSIISRQSFEEIEQFVESILQSKEMEEDRPEGLPIPIVICGNKCDLTNQREVPTDEARKMCEKYGIPFFEVSAKTRMNVEDAFMSLATSVWKEKGKRKKAGNCTVQ